MARSAGILPAWHPARMSSARRESRPGRCPVLAWRRPFGAGSTSPSAFSRQERSARAERLRSAGILPAWHPAPECHRRDGLTHGAMPRAGITPPLRGWAHLTPGPSPARRGVRGRSVSPERGHPARVASRPNVIGATRVSPGAMPRAGMAPPLRGWDYLTPGPSPARRGECGRSVSPERGHPARVASGPNVIGATRISPGAMPRAGMAPPLRGWDLPHPRPFSRQERGVWVERLTGARASCPRGIRPECHRRDENLARGDAPCWHGAAPSGLGIYLTPGPSPARRGESGRSVSPERGHPARVASRPNVVGATRVRPGRCPVLAWRRPFGAGSTSPPARLSRQERGVWREIGALLTGGLTESGPGRRRGRSSARARQGSPLHTSHLRAFVSLRFRPRIRTGHDLPARRRACGKGPASGRRETLGTRDTPSPGRRARLQEKGRGDGASPAGRRPQQPPKGRPHGRPLVPLVPSVANPLPVSPRRCRGRPQGPPLHKTRPPCPLRR